MTGKKWEPVHPRGGALPSGKFELKSEPGSDTMVTAEVEVPTNREDSDDAG
jgi:hypothetical protein